MHSVDEDTKLAATTKGGRIAARALSRPDAENPRLTTVPEIQRFLQTLSGEILRGVISSRDANTLRAIAETSLRAHDSNIAQRLDELEKIAAARARAASSRVVRSRSMSRISHSVRLERIQRQLRPETVVKVTLARWVQELAAQPRRAPSDGKNALRPRRRDVGRR